MHIYIHIHMMIYRIIYNIYICTELSIYLCIYIYIFKIIYIVIYIYKLSHKSIPTLDCPTNRVGMGQTQGQFKHIRPLSANKYQTLNTCLTTRWGYKTETTLRHLRVWILDSRIISVGNNMSICDVKGQSCEDIST